MLRDDYAGDARECSLLRYFCDHRTQRLSRSLTEVCFKMPKLTPRTLLQTELEAVNTEVATLRKQREEELAQAKERGAKRAEVRPTCHM